MSYLLAAIKAKRNVIKEKNSACFTFLQKEESFK